MSRLQFNRHAPALFLITFNFLCTAFAASGCAPRWHSGHDGHVAIHKVESAQVLGDSLSVQGCLSLLAYSDYGIKLVGCRDDTGRELRLRSTQIFWAKDERFELELDPPSSGAAQIEIDVMFRTRSGTQRIRKTLRLDRSGQTSYTTALRAFEAAIPQFEEQVHARDMVGKR